MQEKLQSWFNKLLEKWNNIERKQQFKLIAVAVMVAIALGLAVYFTFQPKMTEFAHDLTSAEIVGLQDALDRAGIKNKLKNGIVYIDEKKKYEAVAMVYETNVSGLEKYDFSSFLANSGMGTTSLTQNASLHKNKESDVSRILENFDGVIRANVILNIPDDTYTLVDSGERSSASITITTSDKYTHTPQKGEAMARAVQSAVAKLDMENISIYDQEFNPIYNGSVANASGGYSSQAEYEAVEKAKIETQIRHALSVSYSDVRFISNIRFNWDKVVEAFLRNYIPTDLTESTTGLPTREDIYIDKSTGTNYANAPGTDENDLVGTYQTGDGTNYVYNIKESAIEYVYDTVSSQTEYAVGQFLADNSSIAVYAFRDVYYHEDVLRANGTLDNITWQEFQTSIPATTLVETDAVLLESIQLGSGMQSVALLIYERPQFISSEPAKPLDIWLIVVLALLFVFLLLLAYALIRNTHPDEITEIEPELSVEDLLVSTQLEEEKQAAIDKLKDIEYGADSEVMKQIEKFVTERPEAVAGLLRNWLNDEWD